jgi:PLP dependent protein
MEDYERQAADNLAAVRSAIATATRRAGRSVESVSLIAISKTQPQAAVAAMIAAGQTIFGENRVQEAAEKFPALRDQFGPLELHLVGQLQSNKASEAVALFDMIHSVDRLSLVDAIARASQRQQRRPGCFVQVNIGEEAQKGGCAIAELPALLRAAQAAELDIRGLMAVPPADREAAPYFALLAKLARDHGLAGLSIGMTNDFESAIMLGATYVRIGSALFGARS